MTLSSWGRVAAFYAPEPDDVLFTRGAAWLGRDPETGAPVAQPEVPGIEEFTAEPRLYGLHATLKPPMRVRPGVTWERVLEEAVALMHGIRPFALPPLGLADLDGFLALRELEPSTPLQAFADLCVAGLDHLRAEPSEQELARRRRVRLSISEETMLARFGYPYVFTNWRFHLTLTRRLAEDERARIADAARDYFADINDVPRVVASLCLFCQPEPGAPFRIAERIPLRG